MSFQFDGKTDKKICSCGLGEVLYDILPSGSKLGGAPANFAYYCQQMSTSSMVVSAVGNDSLGIAIRSDLNVLGLNSILSTVSYPTGFVRATLDQSGNASYNFAEDCAYDHLPFNDQLAQFASTVDLVCFGTLAQRSPDSRSSIRSFLGAMSNRSVRVFDVNLRSHYYTWELIEQCLPYTTVFKCNEDELPVLCDLSGLPRSDSDLFYGYLRARGIDCLIYTKGSGGSLIYLNDELSVLAGLKVQVKDTVGAGDAFTAVAVCSLLQGDTLDDAHGRASEVASYVCTQSGAMTKLPLSMLGC